eukprot:TRINITY_DN612_c0_g1_i2.p1 TRINITY_DN612_c0_g1~~TRINITY_DN612_c0_g1_i2.p1  ORF type:complete len:171 (+),score=19.06 TRINITY_DN612_c0_g1_i2:25-513(+)
MSIYSIDPWVEIKRMHRDMDNIFNNTLGLEGTGNCQELTCSPSNARDLRSWRPKVDITESGDTYVIHAELPGVKKEDVSIDFHGNNITISGQRSYEKKHETEKYHHTERSFGKFTRSIPIPKGTNSADIKASYDNGVLEITAPKPKEQAAQKITIAEKSNSN